MKQAGKEARKRKGNYRKTNAFSKVCCNQYRIIAIWGKDLFVTDALRTLPVAWSTQSGVLPRVLGGPSN